MSLKKEISYIQNIIIEIDNCTDAEKFYELCTGLYFHINCLVYNFRYCKFSLDEKENSKKELPNYNRFIKLEE